MPTTSTRRSPTRWLAAVLAVAVVGLAACGGADPEVRAGGSATTVAAATSSGGGGGDLPVLPPVEERQPEQFDERGCLVIGPGRSDCATTAADVDAGAAGRTEGDDRSLLGFVGSQWLTGATGGPTVLADTITTGAGADGTWRAVGLVRNEGPDEVAALEVHARLLDVEGHELGVVSAPAAVGSVRSGEPVPFSLGSAVPAAEVGSVEWGVAGLEGPASERAMEIAVYWTRPAGGEGVEHYLHQDAPGDRPQLLFASVTARGARPVPEPRLVVAWIDPDGAVVGVADAAVVGPDTTPLAALDPGAAGDAMVVTRDPLRPDLLAGAVPMVWAVGS